MLGKTVDTPITVGGNISEANLENACYYQQIEILADGQEKDEGSRKARYTKYFTSEWQFWF